MKRLLIIVLGIFIFLLLTVITQIGGFVYILSIIVCRWWKREFRFKRLLIFLLFYVIFTLVIVPVIAPIFGRERIQNSDKIKPSNFGTILLNRNYVKPELNLLLSKTSKRLRNTEIEIHYLDANFPFLDRFPLLPHLSHNDGKKLDISLIYESKNAEISYKQKSFSGYGNFEHPKAKEHNQIRTCLSSGYYQYDYPKYLTLGKINEDLKFSEKGTAILIKKLLASDNLGKLFIEPHLKERMKLNHSKIRYHGCRAVRHDDHIHIQLK